MSFNYAIDQVVEHGLGHLPFTEKQVVTPTGNLFLFMLDFWIPCWEMAQIYTVYSERKTTKPTHTFLKCRFCIHWCGFLQKVVWCLCHQKVWNVFQNLELHKHLIKCFHSVCVLVYFYYENHFVKKTIYWKWFREKLLYFSNFFCNKEWKFLKAIYFAE